MEKEAKNETEKYFLISPHYFLILLVGLLIIFSVVQSSQISSIKSELRESGVLSTSANVKSSGVQAAVKSTASAAPTMVGGC